MDKVVGNLRILFHILILLLIIISLYPGSILGFIIYGDLGSQPKLTRNFFYISSNHLYVYFFISTIGFFSYINDRKFKLIFLYLFFLSIMLEALHAVIPLRSFQIEDLVGNILGVLTAYIIVLIYKFWKK